MAEKSTSFRFLWVGQSLANCGNVFYIVGLIATIYAATGSATTMALVPFFVTASRFLSGLIAPLIIDRIRLRLLLVYSQCGKTIVTFLLAGFSTYLFTENIIYLIFIFVVMIAFLDGWATPARNALLPQLVEVSGLVKANSFMAILDQTIRLAGWPVGGILVVAIGAGNVIWLTFLLFVLSSIMMMLIKDSQTVMAEKGQEDITKWDALKEGWLTIWRMPALRTISAVEFIESIASVVWIAAIIYVYVDRVLHAGEQWWGYINASFFAGLMIGGFFSLRWSHQVNRHLSRFIVWGAFIGCITTGVFGLISAPWLALFISMIFGFATQIKDVAQQTITQTSVTHRLLPKVYSAQDTIISATFGLSTLLLGYLTDLLGVRFVFLFAAALLFISAIFVMINRRHLMSGEWKEPEANVTGH